MKEKLISIMREASQQIFTELSSGTIVLIDTPTSDGDVEVAINLGITGQVKGTILFKSSNLTAMNIGNIMLSKIGYSEPNATFSTSHKEAVCEFTNLVCGRTLSLLSENGIDCNLTPPTLITGVKVSPHMPQVKYTINLSISGDFGHLEYSFAVKSD